MDVVLDILNADSLAITPEFLKLIAVLSEVKYSRGMVQNTPLISQDLIIEAPHKV